MNTSLRRSYSYCEALAKREAGNFYPAFRLLPNAQRLAMCALYAFMRIADDLADEPSPPQSKRAQLENWRNGWEESVRGTYSHPCHEALADTVRRYGIPPAYLHELLSGVEMDAEPRRFEAFADLKVYCYRVASVVGLACIQIWGFKEEKAKIYAEQAGLAFQLTNILRDLGEDAGRGRVYLPQEDLDHFGYSEEKLKQAVRDKAYKEMMRFEVERARAYYLSSRPLASLLSSPGRAVFSLMSKTYERLLDEIEARDYDVFTQRVKVNRWRKLWFALQAYMTR